jgi:hypothetical protein
LVVENPRLFGVESTDPGSRQILRHGSHPVQNDRASNWHQQRVAPNIDFFAPFGHLSGACPRRVLST